MSGNVSIHGISATETLANGKVKWVPIKVDSEGNLKISLGTNLAGERNQSSTTGTGYFSIASEWLPVKINTNATGDVVVYNGPCLVKIVRVRATTDAGAATTNTAGIILVKNGTSVIDGAASGKTPGYVIYDGLDGTMFRTSFILNFASGLDNPASDGKIECLIRPLDNSTVWTP